MPAPYDQQWIASTSGGFLSRSKYSKLCDSCGQKTTCSIRGPAITHCHVFMPVLSFKSELGLSGSFNTFRRGTAWARRVRPDLRVGLYSIKRGCIVGHGVVSSVHQGMLGELLPPHARMNHLIKGEAPPDAISRMQRVLRNTYGSNYSLPTEAYSVIYIEAP